MFRQFMPKLAVDLQGEMLTFSKCVGHYCRICVAGVAGSERSRRVDALSDRSDSSNSSDPPDNHACVFASSSLTFAITTNASAT